MCLYIFIHYHWENNSGSQKYWITWGFIWFFNLNSLFLQIFSLQNFWFVVTHFTFFLLINCHLFKSLKHSIGWICFLLCWCYCIGFPLFSIIVNLSANFSIMFKSFSVMLTSANPFSLPVTVSECLKKHETYSQQGWAWLPFSKNHGILSTVPNPKNEMVKYFRYYQHFVIMYISPHQWLLDQV